MVLVVVVGLPLLGGGLAAAYYRGRPARRPPRLVKAWTPELWPSARIVDGRTMAIRAEAKMTDPFRDAIVWFRVEVRRARDGGGSDVIYAHEFDEPAGWFRARRMQEIRPVLPEVRVALPGPGCYHAFVALMNDGVYLKDGVPIPGGNRGPGRITDYFDVP
jgi:hypothetical protein